LRPFALLAAGAAALAASEARAWELVVCADSNALPFSARDETGFENRLAQILADEMGATITYYWVANRREASIERMRQGVCDVILGQPDGAGAVMSTITYYRSPYVFVQRADADYRIQTFDDPQLRELRLGIFPNDSPAHHALERRGLGNNIVIDETDLAVGPTDAFEPIFGAVADGTVDVAVVWGPAAGYYASREVVELVVTPVPPFEPPLIPMYINMTVGVRLGDEFLRDLIDIAIVNRWQEIQALLDDMGIPRMDLPPPILTLDVPG
jgi:quinoprotein dehydrogenase-associated probable ABC transporter substrate-binding protein